MNKLLDVWLSGKGILETLDPGLVFWTRQDLGLDSCALSHHEKDQFWTGLQKIGVQSPEAFGVQNTNP